MSAIADLIEARQGDLIRRWTARAREHLVLDKQPLLELDDHIPDYLQELVEALRGARAPSGPPAASRVSLIAREHAHQRLRLGFDADAVVREYSLLHGCILDLVEETGCPLALPEVRALNDHQSLAVAEGISAYSVTEKKQAEAVREGLLKDVEAARTRLDTLIANAPAFVCTLRGPRHEFELVNTNYQGLVGAGRPLVGLEVATALPEAVEQGFTALLDDVYRTGEPIVGRALRLLMKRGVDGQLEESFVDFTYQPRRDARGQVEGIDAFGFDITEQVRARQRLEALTQRLIESEERYRMATRATKDAIWDWDLVTNGVRWNEGLHEQFGHEPDEVVPTGDWWVETIHPEDRERVAQSIHAIIDVPAGGSDWRDEYRFRRRDGSWALVNDRGWVTRDASGRAVRMVGAMEDVTERKAAEDLRARQSQHYALGEQVGLALSRSATLTEVLQGCVEAVARQMGAASARIWLWNPRDEALELRASAGLSTPFDDALARVPLGQLKIGLIAEQRTPYLTNAVEDDLQVSDPAWARREGLVAFAGLPLLVGERLVGVVALFSRKPLSPDTFAALHQTADGIALGVERLRAEGELRKRVDFEQQLIGIVSHDLRNPLSAILMAAALLIRREDLDPRALKLSARIQSAAERATRMVKDLLDFTQARLGGGIPLERRPADLHAVVRGVLEEVEAAYPEREVEAHYEGDGRGTWDEDRLSQVVQNLLTNALKYSPEDSLVRVAVSAEEDHVSLSISNGGPPISAEKLPILFEPMQRATSADKLSRSVGLGLYIVRHIVEAHGGAVSVSSTDAEGTTFTARLPRKRA